MPFTVKQIRLFAAMRDKAKVAAAHGMTRKKAGKLFRHAISQPVKKSVLGG